MALVKAGADLETQDNRKINPLIAGIWFTFFCFRSNFLNTINCVLAFRKGHLKVVKYLVRYVTQFPSDQETQRYIQTINDNDKVLYLCGFICFGKRERRRASICIGEVEGNLF